MKRSELKSIVKDCIKEVLFEEGILSNLVAEVAAGITKAQQRILESNSVQQKNINLAKKKQNEAAEEEKRKQLLESKRKMLDAMGSRKMANVFEGTEPLRSGGEPNATPGTGPLTGRDPNDSGVDISGIFNLAGHKWDALK